MGVKAEFLKFLELFIKTPSVIGTEHTFLLHLKRELETLNIKATLYEGLLEAQGEDKSGITLCSHVDRHGLVCTGPDEFQYASFTTRFQGDLDGQSRSEQLLNKIENRFLDERVIAYDPWSGKYIGQGVITSSSICPRRNNLIFSVSGLEGIVPGIPLAYNDQLTVDGDWIRAQLDNVLSAAVILTLYKRGFQGRALFTCEEEAGRSWRYLLSYFHRNQERTSRLLVLDTSPFDSAEEASFQDIVLRNKDNFAEFDATFTAKLVQTCDDYRVDYCKKDAYIEEKNANGEDAIAQSIGVTELGRLIKGSQNRITGTTFQFPTFDYHTQNESYHLKSLPNAIKVLEAFIASCM
ncbi:MAG: putative aminopeptidase FrvX [Nitrospinales bacterium]|jgi:putative aminopeptidase FrvX